MTSVFRARDEGLAVLPPDIAFQHCANSAAAVSAQAPPFVTYRVATHVSAPRLGKTRDVIRAVMVRTQDDLAVIQDLPQGANALGHGFPITPVFDALSYFVLSWRVGTHMDVSSYVHDIKPITYDKPNSSADVIVVRLRQYHVAYADDSSDAPNGRTHIVLTPYPFVKNAANPDTTFFLSDVIIDNATGLPATVRYAGEDDASFSIDYRAIDGHWMVTHAHYETTLHGPLRIGMLHVIADANYDRFAFPLAAPDPRLGALPAATPSPATAAPPTKR